VHACSDVPVALVDSALASLQKLIQVERTVMDRLFWPNDPVMQSVHAAESWVVALKQRIHDALSACLPVAEQFLTTLKPFVEFLNLDVDLFLQHLAYKNRETFDLAALKALVVQHRCVARVVACCAALDTHLRLARTCVCVRVQCSCVVHRGQDPDVGEHRPVHGEPW
jgi:hypothetical protein